MNPISSLFVRLFRGRGDAYGTWEGGSVRRRLTEERFHTHLHSADPADWFGVYNVIEDQCSWGCVDIDEDDEPLAVNIKMSLSLQNVHGWIEHTTRGFHVWVFPREPLVQAATMRDALTAACLAVNYSPKEVFPKQDSARGTQLGNYVRLPLNGAYSGVSGVPTRQFEQAATLVLMDHLRAASADLVRLAALHHRPQVVDNPVEFQEGVELDDTLVNRLPRRAQRILTEGPLPGSDRSSTLVRLAYILSESGFNASEALAVVTAADRRWGKFTPRGDKGDRLLVRLVAKAYSGVYPEKAWKLRSG